MYFALRPREAVPGWLSGTLRFVFFAYGTSAIVVVMHHLGGSGWLAILLLAYPVSELNLHASSRTGFSGSTLAILACTTMVDDMNGSIVLEPMGSFPVVRDLKVDRSSLFEGLAKIQAWHELDGLHDGGRECARSQEAVRRLQVIASCIMCGACVSDCPVLETELNLGKPVEETFLAPAALAKAYRFVGDPRDAMGNERLLTLSRKEGMWDCTRCNMCVEVCPKSVAPMDQILALRRKAIEAGLEETLGARHTLEFEKTVRESAWL